jgi:hypothetical protein
MKVAASNIYQNVAVDSGLKSNDQPLPRVDKTIEEFYAVCDQIELNLKTTTECTGLASSGQRYTSIPLLIPKPDHTGTPDAVTYNQLVSTVKTQVMFAKEVHDALAEAARTITAAE